MNQSHPTLQEIDDAVRSSGFPMQFEVAKQLLDLGFDVHPSTRFLNRGKGRESEIDVLAHRTSVRQTRSGKSVDITLRIALEAKDTALPFVLFGLERDSRTDERFVDTDAGYIHIDTTRDRGIRNRFGMAASDSVTFNPGWAKDQHHQLRASPRYYLATTLEYAGKALKLHQPEKLWNALATLGALQDYVHHFWSDSSRRADFEEASGGNLRIFVTYLALVHRGPHYCYDLPSRKLTEARLSSVFMSHSAGEMYVPFVVDFVQLGYLEEAVERIETTTQALLTNLAGTIYASS